MTFCHECGSEVAENDAFCPYCGITLHPIEVPPDQEEEAFASTIMMPLPKSSKINGAAEPIADISTEAHENNVSAVPAVAAEDTKPDPSVNDMDEPLPDIDDIPPPVFLQEHEKESPSVIDTPIPAEAENSEAVQPLIEKARQSEEPGSVAVSVDESSLGQDKETATPSEGDARDFIFDRPTTDSNFDPTPLVENFSQEKADEYNFEANLEEVVDISPTGSVLPPVKSDSAEDIATRPEELHADEQPSEPAPVAASSPTPTETNVGPISMPSEELEDIDSFPSSPMFDSVRIIDNRSSDANPPSPVLSGTAASSENVPSPLIEQSSRAEARSQTAPNIGLVDTDGRKSAKLKTLEEGTVLNGRYEIIRKIGGGGMGAVYLASDNNLGGVLRAVKEMVQSYIEEAQQEKAIEDFKRESMILSSLDHQCIPTIYDYFFDEKESRFYLVMKYISGGDLSARLRAAPEGRIDEKTVTEWAIQISDVLDYLHNQPSTIVYRDLKPSNIMIDGNSGRVVLIDFGIARSIGQIEEKGVTAVGTMGYAPPELFSGNVEPRSDIYSLGSTMFHLLTGADPQSNPLLIFDFQKNPRPRQINSQLSDQMEKFLMRSVEYNADARFSGAAEMKQYLTEHLESLKRGTLTYGVKEIPASISLENQAVFCGFCGQKIVATDLFCAFCGAKQPIAQQGVHSEIYSHAPLTAKLVMVGTSDLDTPIFSLEKDETLIGRRDPMSNIFPEVDLSRYDPQTKISRRHARIWREGSTYLVEDLGSSNGTVLLAVGDSIKLAPRQPHALTSGDKIRVGDTMLHFVVG